MKTLADFEDNRPIAGFRKILLYESEYLVTLYLLNYSKITRVGYLFDKKPRVVVLFGLSPRA